MDQRSGVVAALVLFCATCAPGQQEKDERVADRGREALESIPNYRHKRVCDGPRTPGHARCQARVRVDAKGEVVTSATPQGLGPADFQSAYKIPSGSAGVIVGIVDAQDDPNAESDLAVYRQQFGLPPCTTANGCFRKVNQSGQASPLPGADPGWAGEISLDLDAVSAACPACRILLVEANSSSTADLGTAVNTAAALGAAAITNSYGGDEDSSSPTYDRLYYNHPGVLITACSGDGGYGVEYPASGAFVVGVGGTSLVKASNARGWTEGVWNSGGGAPGSGCSQYTAKPSFQTDPGCAKRTVADVSADADPNTGAAVYDTYGGPGFGTGWQVFGGTSLASPLVAAIFAASGKASVGTGFIYANTPDFNDVTSGTNVLSGGAGCSGTKRYLCAAQAGYDGPTGWGTPNGTLIAASSGGGGGGGGGGDFTIALSPASVTVAQGSTAIYSISTAPIGASENVALGVAGLPSGATAVLGSSTIVSGQTTSLTISVGPGVAQASYSLTVTGSAGTTAHAAVAGLVVTASGGGGGTCRHSICHTGKRLRKRCDPCVREICNADPYCCTTRWDSVCVGQVQSICGESCGTAAAGAEAAHDACAQGERLEAEGDSCARAVCASDSFCCSGAWDASCVSLAEALCGKTCN